MKLSETIYKRKSVRSYLNEAVNNEDLKKILDFIKTVKPLYPDILVDAEIVERKKMKSVLPLHWLPKQHIAIFSEDKEVRMWALCFNRWIYICKAWVWVVVGWA